MQASQLWRFAQLTRSAAGNTRSLSAAGASGEARQLLAACVLERLPVVIPGDFSYELEYQALKEHLFQKYRQDIPAEYTKVLGDEVEATGEQGRGAFQPAPRVTEADHRKDVKSLQRALDKRLFLIVKAEGIEEGFDDAQVQSSLLAHSKLPDVEPSETNLNLIRSDSRRQWSREWLDLSTASLQPGSNHQTDSRECAGESSCAKPPQGGAYSDYVWATRAELPEYVTDSTQQMLFKLMLSE